MEQIFNLKRNGGINFCVRDENKKDMLWFQVNVYSGFIALPLLYFFFVKRSDIKFQLKVNFYCQK